MSPKIQNSNPPRPWSTLVDTCDFSGVPEATFRRYCDQLGVKGDGTFRGSPVFSVHWVRAFKAIAPLMQKAGKLARSGNESHAKHLRDKAKQIMLSKIPAATVAPPPQASKAIPKAPAIKAAPKNPKRPKVRTLSAEEAEKIRTKFFAKK